MAKAARCAVGAQVSRQSLTSVLHTTTRALVRGRKVVQRRISAHIAEAPRVGSPETGHPDGGVPGSRLMFTTPASRALWFFMAAKD